MTHRKQAPKQPVNGPNMAHPDWFWNMSGGIDSTAAYLVTRGALHDNYGKRPVMTYWDTRIGLPLNKLYLEELADVYGEQLWPLRTNEKFEDRVAEREKFADRDDTGPPGGAQHGPVRNEIKGRQAEKLHSLADLPVHVVGLRAEESDNRAEMPKIVEKKDHIEVYPVHRLSKRECAEIILRYDAPINPLWLWRHPSDCFCLANGDPSELDRAQGRFPWFAQRIREYEEAAEADGYKDILGWDGLYAVERDAKQLGQEQEKLTTCGAGCQRRLDQRIVRAFDLRLNGATIDESVSALYPQTGAGRKAVADGGL